MSSEFVLPYEGNKFVDSWFNINKSIGYRKENGYIHYIFYHFQILFMF